MENMKEPKCLPGTRSQRNELPHVARLFTNCPALDPKVPFHLFRDHEIVLAGDVFGRSYVISVGLYFQPERVEGCGRYPSANSEVGTHLEKFGIPTSLWTRIKWWYMDKETAAELAKLEGYNRRITAVQLTFLLR